MSTIRVPSCAANLEKIVHWKYIRPPTLIMVPKALLFAADLKRLTRSAVGPAGEGGLGSYSSQLDKPPKNSPYPNS